MQRHARDQPRGRAEKERECAEVIVPGDDVTVAISIHVADFCEVHDEKIFDVSRERKRRGGR